MRELYNLQQKEWSKVITGYRYYYRYII
jgi:hypothetical protein